MHFRNHHLLLLIWVLIVLMITGNFGKLFGLKHLFLDPEPRLNPVQRRAPCGKRLAAIVDPQVRDRRVEIVPDGLGEFRLIAIPADDIRIIPHPAHGGLKGLRRDTLRQRPHPKRRDP